MKNIKLGDFSLDLARLIETRLLIQANSGGGKSYAIRKLLEETHGKVQQIVLDVEGEFATLREKFDYVLAGKGGDVPADPRSAELLARKVLELQASVIVDLYELKHHERIKFVKLFLDALVNAPKELWHEVLVVVDEAHVFAPEKGHAESLGSVIDLATRGRKRGYCVVLATQRLSKLHKDAAAECNNKLIGRTGLDVDVKRAVEELGMTAKDGIKLLRELEPGEFFSFGPALSREVVKVKIGQVETKHPKAGQRLGIRAPAPTAKVKQILGKLTDLPKEAEEELRDRGAMQAKIRELERELRSKPAAVPEVSKGDVDKIRARAAKEARAEAGRFIKQSLSGVTARLGDVLEEKLRELKDWMPTVDRNIAAAHSTIATAREMAKPRIVPIPQRASKPLFTGERKFGRCELAILQFLAGRAGRAFSKIQVGARTHYSPKSSGFQNSLSSLSAAGFLVRDQGLLQISPAGLDFARESGLDTDTGGTPLEAWKNSLGKCERAIFEQLLADHGEWSKDMLASSSGYSVSSSGFQNALSYLCSLGLARRVSSGGIQLNEEIVGI